MKPPRKTNPLSFARLAGIANLIGPAKPAAKKATGSDKKEPVSARLATAFKSVGRGPTAAQARTKAQVGTVPQKGDVVAKDGAKLRAPHSPASKPTTLKTPSPPMGTAGRPPVSARLRPVDDDSAEEMRGNGPAAAARRRERERCQAIVCSPVGLRHPALAASLAFGSRLHRSEAIVLLNACDRPPQSIEQIASTLKSWSHSHA